MTNKPKIVVKRKCPICKVKDSVPVEDKLYPFCGKQCKTIDLGKWATGDYKVEADEQHTEKDGDD